MCLAVPAKVLEVNGDEAVISIQGVRRTANLMLLEDGAQPGEYVLLHAGFALRKWTEADVKEYADLTQDGTLTGIG
jgi:hydrogenase expression/formation protein HypC